MGRVGVDEVPLIDQGTANLLAALDVMVVQQRINWIEAATCGCFEQPNVYDVFDPRTGARVMELEEVSHFCTRCCCAPHHSFLLNFYVVDPATGQRLAHAMTMERNACCTKPCATCCACSDCCLDGFALHAGQAGPAAGRIADRSRLIGAAAQPRGGGGLRPQLQIMDRTVDGTCEFAKVRGPRCFGGCSELCCDNRFGVERIFDARLGADPFPHEAAVITRRKPDSFAGFARELFTDADVYTIDLTDKSYTPQQKAAVLATMAQLDYMFFEKDGDACSSDGSSFTVRFFNCYCYGCVWPCSITFSQQGGSGGSS